MSGQENRQCRCNAQFNAENSRDWGKGHAAVHICVNKRKDVLSWADFFINPEPAQGNPAYKAWQILNPGFFVTQDFEHPVCDLSRGDDDPEKIIATVAYLTIKAFSKH